MRTAKRLALCLGAAALGAGLGLAVSFLLAAPRGPEHHCASRAPRLECTYPPNYAHWHIGWVVAGFIVGLIAALIALNAYKNRRPSH